MEVFALLRAQRQNRHRLRKSSWAFPRPQFWFEHMVLRQHEDNIWREHFRMSKKTFEYVCCLVGRDCIPHAAVGNLSFHSSSRNLVSTSDQFRPQPRFLLTPAPYEMDPSVEVEAAVELTNRLVRAGLAKLRTEAHKVYISGLR